MGPEQAREGKLTREQVLGNLPNDVEALKAEAGEDRALHADVQGLLFEKNYLRLYESGVGDHLAGLNRKLVEIAAGINQMSPRRISEISKVVSQFELELGHAATRDESEFVEQP